MPSAVKLRTDFTASELRRLAKKAKDVNQSRRLLSLAAVLDGMSRTEAAMIGGMDRQTLRDWVHRFNAAGPDGLLDNWASGPVPRLSAAQKGGSALIIASATWERFSGNSASRTSLRGRVIRPRMPRRSQLIKKLCLHAERPSARSTKGNSCRNLVPGRGPHRSKEWPRPPMG